MPSMHTAVPFARSHVAPHAPQFASVSSAVSQPLLASPSQSAKPSRQRTSSQIPLAHDDSALGSAHVVPHLPQLSRVVRSVSQPSAELVLQSPQSGSHVLSAFVHSDSS